MSVYDRDDLDDPRWFEWAAIGVALLILRVGDIMKHRHPDRLAETYRRDPDDCGRLIWVGYVADQPAGAVWSDELQSWILSDQGLAS